MNKTQSIFELSCPYANIYQGPRKRLLFVCSAGMLRSPTAAAVATSLGYNARSCGTGNYALIQLSANLITWAERIYFVNEENFHEAIETFAKSPIEAEIHNKSIIWDIPDNYNYMDVELVSMVHELMGAAPKF